MFGHDGPPYPIRLKILRCEDSTLVVRRRAQHPGKDPSSCVAYPENVCRGKRNGTVLVM
ncbi:hypothetical protein GCM10010517_22700 [Streptosporangium fragile]|uniref:Uncharacterized protein n=1 Tax=Streptosporangium fragile TaxID=46186 RepID=A0ABN3VVH4_9ACTN